MASHMAPPSTQPARVLSKLRATLSVAGCDPKSRKRKRKSISFFLGIFPRPGCRDGSNLPIRVPGAGLSSWSLRSPPAPFSGLSVSRWFFSTPDHGGPSRGSDRYSPGSCCSTALRPRGDSVGLALPLPASPELRLQRASWKLFPLEPGSIPALTPFSIVVRFAPQRLSLQPRALGTEMCAHGGASGSLGT